MPSFYVEYASRNLMLGAVYYSRSCRYESHAAAICRAMVMLDASPNRADIHVRIMPSKKSPEITLDDSGPDVRRYIVSGQYATDWNKYQSRIAPLPKCRHCGREYMPENPQQDACSSACVRAYVSSRPN